MKVSELVLADKTTMTPETLWKDANETNGAAGGIAVLLVEVVVVVVKSMIVTLTGPVPFRVTTCVDKLMPLMSKNEKTTLTLSPGPRIQLLPAPSDTATIKVVPR